MRGRSLRVGAAMVVYRAMLRVCFPAGFRVAHGREIERAFESLVEEADGRGAWARAILLVRGVRDLVVEGSAERAAIRASAARRTSRRALRDTLRLDLLHSLRAMRKRPLFAAVVVGTVAVGVGANTAIFSVVNGVLLRPYAWPDADRVVVIWDSQPSQGRDRMRTTGPTLRDWKERATSFSSVAGMMPATWTLGGDGGGAARINGVRVDADYFTVLGAEPRIGRTFRPEEVEGGAAVVILSDALWRSRYGGDPGVLGRVVELDGRPFEIVGVMPPVPFAVPLGGLTVPPPEATMVFTPYRSSDPWLQRRNSHIVTVIARIRADATLGQARAEMAGIARGLGEEYPAAAGIGTRVVPLREQVVGDVRRDLLVVFGAVGLVLVLACANLTNLLLARVVERRREFALRLALGAGRGGLVRQMATEVGVLVAFGGLAGLAVAWRGVAVLPRLLPPGLPRQESIAVDPAVLLFTLAATLATSALVALGPAYRASEGAGRRRGDAGSGSRATAGRHELRLHRWLVVSQVAIATVLLVAAGLLLRSFSALRSVDPGFDPDRLATAAFIVPTSDQGSPGSLSTWLDALVEDVRETPGVASAALAYDPPLVSTWWEGFAFADRPIPPGEAPPDARLRIVGDGYFETAGIEVVRGRSFGAADRGDGPGAIIVNEAFVRRFLPAADPIGVRINHSGAERRFGPEAGFPTTFTIVGVVRDVRFMGPRQGSAPAFYMPIAQYPVTEATLLVRRIPGADLASVDGAVARPFRTRDAASPPPHLVSIDDDMAQLVAQDRFNTFLITIFGLLALALSAAGIHAVLSYAIARRRTELGVRTALGASPSRLRSDVLAETARMCALGLGAGIAGSLALGRILSGLLFGVPATDPPTFLSVAATLAFVALLSGWIPARKAAATLPAAVLSE